MSSEAEKKPTEVKEEPPIDENSIRVLLGETSTELQFPNEEKKWKLFGLKLLDLAKLEDYTGETLQEMSASGKNRRINVMLYCVWLALGKNLDFKLSFEDFGDKFTITNINEVVTLVNAIFTLSGLDTKNVVGADKNE